MLLLCIVVIFDQFTGRILRKFYFSQKSDLFYRTTYAIDSTKAEILIFGSSRANHHYVPELFENGLKMSYYNTGRDGNFIMYNYAVFKAILKRYAPKIIILDINPDEFYSNKTGYDRLSSLLPYYENHPEIRNIINLRSPYEKYKLLSAIYPFNSTLLTIGIGNLEINKNRKPDHKGYVALLGKMEKTNLNTFNNPSGSIDFNKVHALDSISELCFINKVKLFLCYSPVYGKVCKTNVDSLISKIADKYKFKYFNFSNDHRFINQPSLFRDYDHLNNDGAVKYSTLVVDSIEKML